MPWGEYPPGKGRFFGDLRKHKGHGDVLRG